MREERFLSGSPRRPGALLLALAGVTLLLAGGHAGADPGAEANVPPNRTAAAQRVSGRRARERRAPNPAPTEITDAAFNNCNKVARGKRVVQVTLPPDTDVNHLIAWISSLTCKPFVYAFDTTAHNRNVTIIAPKFVTPEEAFGLVLD